MVNLRGVIKEYELALGVKIGLMEVIILAFLVVMVLAKVWMFLARLFIILYQENVSIIKIYYRATISEHYLDKETFIS